MVAWYPRLTQIIDKGFGGSRNGTPITGVVIHHTTSVAPASSLSYVANANSRNSHPTYLVKNSGQAYGIVHPSRRPHSTGGAPDIQAVAFEVDNQVGAPTWATSPAAKETVAQIVAYHYRQSPRFGNGIAKNIPGVKQKEFFVAWHSQYKATACPGPDMVNAGINWIIKRAMQIAHPPVTPTPPPAPTAPTWVDISPALSLVATADIAILDLVSGATVGTVQKGTVATNLVQKTTWKGKDYYRTLYSKSQNFQRGLDASLLAVPLPPPVIYHVVFDDTPDDPNSNYRVVEVESGKTVSPPAEAPVKAGHVFLGWYDLNGSVSAPYDFTRPVVGGLTLVAKFEKIVHDVRFDYDDGSTLVKVVQVDDGAVLEAPVPPTRNGYDFVGWFDTAGNFTEPFDFTVPIKSDENIKAVWESKPPPSEVKGLIGALVTLATLIVSALTAFIATLNQ